MSTTPQLSYEAVFFGFDSSLELNRFSDHEDILKLAEKVTLRLGEDRAEAVNSFKDLEDYFTACEAAYGMDQIVPVDIAIANSGGHSATKIVENLIEGDISFFLPKTLRFEQHIPSPFVDHEGNDSFNFSREAIISINTKVEARSVWSFRMYSISSHTQQIELEEGTKQIHHSTLLASDDDGLLHPIAYRCRKRSRVMGRSIFIMYQRYIDEEDLKSLGVNRCWANIEYNGFDIDVYSCKREFDDQHVGWHTWKRVVATVYDNERLIYSEERYFNFPSWNKKKNQLLILEDFQQRVIMDWIDDELVPEYRDMPGKYAIDVEVYIKTIPFKKLISADSGRHYRKFPENLDKKKVPRKYDSVVYNPPVGAYTNEQYKISRTRAKLVWVKPKSFWLDSPYQIDDV